MKRLESTKLHPVEFALFQERPLVAEAPLGEAHSVLAAVSGGADSIALLHILARLQKRWGFRLRVAYVHHGDTPNLRQSHYRTQAENLVKKLAHSFGFPFIALRADTEVSKREKVSKRENESEDELRKKRLKLLAQEARSNSIDLIAFGHHQDDVFETRLIRLMRGTGPQGLQAMKPLSSFENNQTLWRPLLQTSRHDIEHYLKDRGLKKSKDWLEDPSNRDTRYLRNAIRHKILPLIEKVRPGATEAMARSLTLMVEAFEAKADTGASQIESVELDRVELLSLSSENRRKCLAKWLRGQGIRGISKSHIEEALKRIDTPRKRLSFETGGCTWTVERTIRVQLKQRSI